MNKMEILSGVHEYHSITYFLIFVAIVALLVFAQATIAAILSRHRGLGIVMKFGACNACKRFLFVKNTHL